MILRDMSVISMSVQSIVMLWFFFSQDCGILLTPRIKNQMKRRQQSKNQSKKWTAAEMALVDIMLMCQVPTKLPDVTEFAQRYGFDGTRKTFKALNMRYKERTQGKYSL